MALKNEEVLENLKNQLEEVTKQLNTLTETRIKLLGAVDVLEQIEDSKKEEESTDTVEAESEVVEEGN
jgi:type II secretory pathway component PulF